MTVALPSIGSRSDSVTRTGSRPSSPPPHLTVNAPAVGVTHPQLNVASVCDVAAVTDLVLAFEVGQFSGQVRIGHRQGGRWLSASEVADPEGFDRRLAIDRPLLHGR